MKDYTQGKIYQIVSKTGKRYIGSTTEKLSQRLVRHRQYVRDPTNQGVSSVQILLEDPDAKIVLIENYPCANNDELRAREQYWIEHFEGGSINKYRAYTPPEVVAEKAKTRYEENKEQITEYKRQHHLRTYEPVFSKDLQRIFKTPDELAEEEQIRKEKKRDADAKYRTENLDRVKAKDAAYREKEEVKERARARTKEWAAVNRDRARAWAQEKITCECGASVCRSALSGHRKSKKHQDYHGN